MVVIKKNKVTLVGATSGITICGQETPSKESDSLIRSNKVTGTSEGIKIST